MRESSPVDFSERRERVFIVLAGVFLCAMTLLNVLGITRFIQFGPLQLAVGVLPYPLTFLCTDLISEIYGKRRASFLVFCGFGLNLFILAVMWLGMAASPAEGQPPSWQVLQLAEPIRLANGAYFEHQVELFQIIYENTSGIVVGSMVAYMLAQYWDVQVFHYIKRFTGEKHLWLRNNLSTMTSQLIDTIVISCFTFGVALFAGDISLKQFFIFLGSGYAFKVTVAALDTGPMYLARHYLRRYIGEAEQIG